MQFKRKIFLETLGRRKFCNESVRNFFLGDGIISGRRLLDSQIALFLKYTEKEGKLPEILRKKYEELDPCIQEHLGKDVVEFLNKYSIHYKYVVFLGAVRQRLQLESMETIDGFGELSILFGENWPFITGKESLEPYDTFFDLVRPSLLLFFVTGNLYRRIISLVAARFSILQRFEELVYQHETAGYPPENLVGYKKEEVINLLKNWRNPAFQGVEFINVSPHVKNVLLRDEKTLENLFNNIFKELDYKDLSIDLEGRVVPRLSQGLWKNVFPVVKERVDKKYTSPMRAFLRGVFIC